MKKKAKGSQFFKNPNNLIQHTQNQESQMKKKQKLIKFDTSLLQQFFVGKRKFSINIKEKEKKKKSKKQNSNKDNKDIVKQGKISLKDTKSSSSSTIQSNIQFKGLQGQPISKQQLVNFNTSCQLNEQPKIKTLEQTILKDVNKILDDNDSNEQRQKFIQVDDSLQRRNSMMTRSVNHLKHLFQHDPSPTFKPFRQNGQISYDSTKHSDQINSNIFTKRSTSNQTLLLSSMQNSSKKDIKQQEEIQQTKLYEYDLSRYNSYSMFNPSNYIFSYQEQMKRSLGRKRKSIPQEDSQIYDINLEIINSDGRTTIMIKNIPNKYLVGMLMQQIDVKNQKKYDFFYLPIDYKVFFLIRINVMQVMHLQILYKLLISYLSINNLMETNGISLTVKKQNLNHKICVLKYARIQGRNALIQHFQNSTIMNQKDKKLKPVIKNFDQKKQ